MSWHADWLLTLASVTLFLTALCAILGAVRIYADRAAERAAARRRVRAIQGPGFPASEPSSGLRKPRAQRPVRRSSRGAQGGRLHWLVAQAGLDPMELRSYLAAMALATAAIAVSGVLLGQRTIEGDSILAVTLPPIVAPALVFTCVAAFLRRRAARRRLEFVEQMPLALDIIKRALRAGHPIQGALNTVGCEVPGPVGQEFAATANEITYGLDLREALANLGHRMTVPELRYLIVAVNVQHETGGNLAVILDRLAHLIRARFRLAKKVRVLSAEARLSARLLALMPLMFAGLIFLTRPEVYLHIAEDPLVLPLVLAAAALQLVGVLIMRWLVRFQT